MFIQWFCRHARYSIFTSLDNLVSRSLEVGRSLGCSPLRVVPDLDMWKTSVSETEEWVLDLDIGPLGGEEGVEIGFVRDS